MSLATKRLFISIRGPYANPSTINAAILLISSKTMKRSNQIIIYILLITTIIIVLQSFSITSITTTQKTNDHRRSLNSESISTSYQYQYNTLDNTPYTEYTNFQSLGKILCRAVYTIMLLGVALRYM